MRNDKYLKTLLNRSKRFAKGAACAGLAGCMLVGGSLVAHAATLDDVFDAEQYADDYPDLKAAFGYDRAALLNHYKTFGILEGRQVSGLIDIAKYREEYPDLYAAFGDDWDAYVNHFLTYGILEGRDSGTDLDVRAYAERYADLKEALGDDFLALYQHYKTVGKTEGRIATTVVPEVPKQESTATSQTSSQSNSQSSNQSSNQTGGQGNSQSGSTSGNESTPGTGSTPEDENTPGTGSTPEDENTPGTGSTPEDEDTPGTGNQGAGTETVPNDDGTYIVNEYNDAGKLVKSTHYTSDGKMRYQYTYGVTENHKLEYDANENLIKDTCNTTYVNSFTNDTFAYENTYEYNDAGVRVKSTFRDAFGAEQVSELNEAGKLIRHTFRTSDGWLYKDERFEYDSNGNTCGGMEIYYNQDGSLDDAYVFEYDSNGNFLKSKYYDENGKYQGWYDAWDGGNWYPATDEEKANEPDLVY